MPTATTPGLYFAVAEQQPAAEPLRTDIAGFIGRTERGPVGQAVRVVGLRGYRAAFGGIKQDCLTSYAANGYFENDGEVAWIVRVAGDSQTASGVLNPVSFLGDATALRVDASSPGSWANRAAVTIRYQQAGGLGRPFVDLTVEPAGQTPQYLTGLDPATLAEQVAAHSAYIRVTPFTPPGAVPAAGPQRRSEVRKLYLAGGSDGSPTRQEYVAAARALNDQPEPAILAAPDLYSNLVDDAAEREILSALILRADELRDRLVVLDVPPRASGAQESLAWLDTLRADNGDAMRAAAAYHPWVWVPDPAGGVANPQRLVPPSGHAAGVISRVDRERGAHYTPANAPVLDAFDVAAEFADDQQAELNAGGVNLLRCFRGRGLYVWGGRTGSTDLSLRFVAHRRLIHRLVRAIRRVAEPLVFDTNGPELWLTLVRAITTVLLEAFRAGGLKGATADEAFQVTCDATTNPPEQIDQGMVVCLVAVAPAVPMEFILLRIALSGEGVLEVFES